jgi:hypothetical protein
MENFSISKLGKILNIILTIGFICFIPCFLMSPFMLKNNLSILASCLFIYPNGILMLMIIVEFMRLFKSLEKDDPFTFKNVDILLQTSVISFAMSIIWIIDLILMILVVHNTYINYIIVLLFLFILFLGVSIALFILSILFRKATLYKEENDLTI